MSYNHSGKRESSIHYSVPSTVTSGNFDITLTVVLLRNICGLSPPPTGWDTLPSPGDTSRQADIARVKYFRNTIYGHAEQASVDDVTFNKYWLDIRDALVRLGGTAYGVAIDALEKECMDPEVEDQCKALLKQWKKDDDNIKDKLSDLETEFKKMKQHLDDLTAIVIPPEKEAYFPTDIVRAIRQGYSEYQLHSPSWCEVFNFRLENLFTRLRVLEEKGRGERRGPVTHLPSIFDLRKKALVVGKPGIGKTVYCQKLAYDWAVKHKEFEKFLPEIQVLLSLQCCDFPSNIWEAIDAQLLPDDVNEECKEKFFTFVRENQSKVLLILDGLDVLSPDQLQIISQLLESELAGCYFLLTAEQVPTEKLKERADIRLEIEGFTEEEAKKLISSHFEDQKHMAEKLLDAIDKFDYLRKIVVGNPIYTALLCLLCRDFSGDIPTRRTQLYMEMLSCALKRFDVAKGGSSSKEDLIEVYKDQLTRLGLIDLNYHQIGDLSFEKDEVAFTMRDLPELAFMYPQSASCVRGPRLWYAFQQFFAGFHLASQIVSGEIDLKAVISGERCCTNIFRNVFVFMSGILEFLSEEKALDLVSNMCSRINLGPVSGSDLQETQKALFISIGMWRRW